MGPEEKDDKEVTILGRVVTWRDWGIEYKADPILRKKLLEQMGFLEGSRALTVNGDKEEEGGDEEPLEGEEIKVYRKCAATLNYLSQDSPDVSFGTKEACRGMAAPKRGYYRKMKKVVRYFWEEGGDMEI